MKREEYAQILKKKIDEWNKDIDTLQGKIGQVQDGVKTEYQKRITDIQEQRKDFEQRLKKLRESGDGAWDDIKAGLEISKEAIGDAIKNAFSRF